MCDQLGIKALRPGADGMNRQAPNYQNTDESKANPWPNLPDPLCLKDGRKVTWEVRSSTEGTEGDVPVMAKTIVGHVDNSACPSITVDIQLSLTTPARAKGPVPVMMELGFHFGGFRGASRALDYLETDEAVDAKQVGIEGLSRYGKAALVAMAFDERFAIVSIGSSGAGGAKLYRRNWGELVENLTGSGEYHWMAGNFLKYGGPLNAGDLPVDSHELIALCAPRPTFISYGASSGPGAEGTWVDQKGSFMAAVAAGPVYRLLGKRDLGTDEFPPVETALIDGELAFCQHAGGHTTGPNWPTFLKFADRYIKGPGPPAKRPL